LRLAAGHERSEDHEQDYIEFTRDHSLTVVALFRSRARQQAVLEL
jgi:hypothetical protein